MPQTPLQELSQLPESAFLKEKMPLPAIITHFLERGWKNLLCNKRYASITFLPAGTSVSAQTLDCSGAQDENVTTTERRAVLHTLNDYKEHTYAPIFGVILPKSPQKAIFSAKRGAVLVNTVASTEA